jgi:hypothetical protein
MRVLNADAAYKAVEILRRTENFSVRPTENGFIATSGEHSAFGDNALIAMVTLFKSIYPHLALNFFVEEQKGWY